MHTEATTDATFFLAPKDGGKRSHSTLQVAAGGLDLLGVQVGRAVGQELVTVGAGDALVLAGLLGDVGHLVVREVAHVLGRVAGPELTGRDTAARGHDAAGGDDGVGLHQGAVQDDGAHADERVVLDRARVERAAVADGHVVADVGARGQPGRGGAGRVDDRAVLHVGAVADAHLVEVAADHHVVEHGRVVADLHVAHDRGVGGHPHVVRDLRPLVHAQAEAVQRLAGLADAAAQLEGHLAHHGRWLLWEEEAEAGAATAERAALGGRPPARAWPSGLLLPSPLCHQNPTTQRVQRQQRVASSTAAGGTRLAFSRSDMLPTSTRGGLEPSMLTSFSLMSLSFSNDVREPIEYTSTNATQRQSSASARAPTQHAAHHAGRVHDVRDEVGVAHADGLVEGVLDGRVVVLHEAVLHEARGERRLAHARVAQHRELALHLHGHLDCFFLLLALPLPRD
ncbi:hypothetical protein ON010_g6470 [Phytophthora cinnamomi]|nr:hypothetical protein ON010_g6470 [Phytophthora cinnamomi]